MSIHLKQCYWTTSLHSYTLSFFLLTYLLILLLNKQIMHFLNFLIITVINHICLNFSETISYHINNTSLSLFFKIVYELQLYVII